MPIGDTEAHAAFVRGPDTASEQTAPTSGTTGGDAGSTATGDQAPAAGSDAGGQQPTVADAQQAGQAAATAAKQAGATPAQQQQARNEAIQATLDGKPFAIDPRVQLPYRRGNETVFFPVSEAIRFHMNHRDYTAGKARLEQREAEITRQTRQAEVNQRAFDARQRAFDEERERFLTASNGDDPEEAERYRRHLENMRDPEYRRMYEDSVAKRERDARDEAEGEMQRYDDSQSVAVDVSRYIRDFASRNYPDIKPELIQQAYGEALSSGALKWPDVQGAALDDVLRTLVPQQVRQLFQAEADRRSQYTAPLSGELEQLRAELAELRGQRAADTHNTRTRRAIDRSRNPIGAPAGGNPPAPGGRKAPEPFTSDKLEEKKSAWVRGG